ncbi:MAG TPA: 23S rRNA (uracil(1939)-C(5))-methyltransferase RlmD [Candidatus Jacksonbacteria bacterium]|nr:23S rRNA (uracil(1939)-C(5))-methyltransferase RlmD [Candidatus Jacksonbacteria bacterium]HCC50246.1 23S rRNA (uracil(1939)-C(5))-methyltransferase RlmD [Candidatus Jacksonbacteria bacterium]HCE49530.1 23S rRNA (uracil(1939)-C(5))-methyltransferase RlmD [Candidatus Jacksonbacteria bacterium]HCR15129.1 23S rRNA (uracil(1939)-C(5))-methyltransferase RlmD [Candidatus Jacksonbacteria bacterium]
MPCANQNFVVVSKIYIMILECTIEKLVFGGQALGHVDGQAVFVWNALPGEIVKVEVINKKRGVIFGRAIKILKASPQRVLPQEDHYLSCSPWQIMDAALENEWKGKIAAEGFSRLAKIDLPNTQVIADDRLFGYRNKMEYSFWEENGRIQLAFFERGKKHKFPIDVCALAAPEINVKAAEIVDWLNQIKATRQQVKSLILRSAGKTVIAGLFVTDRSWSCQPCEGRDLCDSNYCIDSRLRGNDKVSNLQIFYSDRRSPASRPDALLYLQGEMVLTEKLLGKTLTYGLQSFFQINPLLFTLALESIAKFLNQDTVVDFYSGVGAISIALADKIKQAILVESEPEAAKFAAHNVKFNNLNNFTVLTGPAEKLREEIKSDRLIIFDPPRAGLHPKIITQLLEVKPPRIIYLACDLATQARDVALLSTNYKLIFNELYNFFPRTPHMESLVVLEAGG